MREKIRSFVNFIVYIAVVLIIAAFIPKVLSYFLQTPYPMATITSSSMWPILKRGDLVIIKHIAPEKLKKGMIVVYRDTGGRGFVIHRIIKIVEDKIITKGDANEIQDDPVEASEIIGVVPSIKRELVKIPYMGYITFLVKSRPSQ